MKFVAIILARGGSKGIPKKNIREFCGKPLIKWTIEQALKVPSLDSVWVSSDDSEILSVAEESGAQVINRPEHLCGDSVTSESGWLHAVQEIESKGISVEVVVGLQATSPLRESKDIESAINTFISGQFDSLFSASVTRDIFIWCCDEQGMLKSITYDYKYRKRRQEIREHYVENGSFYIFRKEILEKYNNRLGGKIGVGKMDFWKLFELDSIEDWAICEALMKHFQLNNLKRIL